MYTIENGWTNTISAKIGLMYIHDYYYAYASGGNPGSYSNAKIAWIFQENNVWTMSRYGFDGDYGYYAAWYVNSSGCIDNYDDGDLYVLNTNAVRPVFYLTSDVEYSSGTGTISDPFLLNE